ncbi:MAG: hypothetical protein NTY30_01180 [Candidatus Berkelbacteria bacterium]|nr:hypothetical protein [Candidatus Berkelbacteria bacterium]
MGAEQDGPGEEAMKIRPGEPETRESDTNKAEFDAKLLEGRISDQKEQVQIAQSQLEKAKAELARLEQLKQDGNVADYEEN